MPSSNKVEVDARSHVDKVYDSELVRTRTLGPTTRPATQPRRHTITSFHEDTIQVHSAHTVDAPRHDEEEDDSHSCSSGTLIVNDPLGSSGIIAPVKNDSMRRCQLVVLVVRVASEEHVGMEESRAAVLQLYEVCEQHASVMDGKVVDWVRCLLVELRI